MPTDNTTPDTGSGAPNLNINYNDAQVGDQNIEDFASDQVLNPTQAPGTVNVTEDVNTEAAGNILAPDAAGPAVETPATAVAQGMTAQADTSAANGVPDLTGATYDASQGTAAQGTVSEDSTVRGQLAGLMDDVDSGTAAWADAAMRSANEAMAARGVGASSLAGAAISQAVLEAAMPIAMQDAKTFAGMDMANLANRQQTMLSNTAAQNAAKQFNAASTNDVDKFMADMRDRLLRFNVEQANAMETVNTTEANDFSQFQASLKSEEAKFNAQNSLLIADSNVAWRRQINTANTAARNAATAQNVAQNYAMSTQQLAELWQTQRDVFSWANQVSENERDRAFALTVHAIDRSEQMADSNKAGKNAMYSSLGSLATNLIGSIGKYWLSK